MNTSIPRPSFADFSKLRSKPFWREAAIILILASSVFLLYLPTLEYPFVFDDGHNIVNNPYIHMNEITLENLKNAGFKSPTPNRPLANISFALNYYFQRSNVSGYRLVNILIHIMCGILIYFLVRTTLSSFGANAAGTQWRWTPFFSALIWLVHPLQTQSVTYVVQRMNTMAAMFYILSLFLYVSARLRSHQRKKWILYTGCLIAGVFAVGTKENAATLPVFIFLYEWYFFQDMSRTWLKKNFFYFALLFGFMVLALFLFVGSHPVEKIVAGYEGRNFTLNQRVLTEFQVVVFYLSLLFVPHPSRLNLDHDFPLSLSLTTPFTTLVSILAITALTALALYGARKERFLSFCIFWFLGNLVIESSVIALEIIFEHRTYLPLVFSIPACVFLVGRYLKFEWFKVLAMILVAAVFALWTYDRNTVWQDEVALWKDCIKKSPGKDRPYYNLGLALEKSGQSEGAIQSYLQAVRINPNHFQAYNNLGVAHAEKAMLEQAVEYYSISLRINPVFDRAHHNLGLALARQGKLDPAIRHFTEALRINPYYANAHHNLGIALAGKGQLDPAISHLKRAVQIKSDFAEAYNNLGLAQLRQGSLKQAVDSFMQALRVDPNYGEARRNLRITLRQIKKHPVSREEN